MINPEPMLVTVEEAAGMLRIGRTKVYELIATGQLRSIRIGAARRVPVGALEALVADRLSKAQQAAD